MRKYPTINNYCYLIHNQLKLDSLIKTIQQEYATHMQREKNQQISLWDTFDRRLNQKHLLIIQAWKETGQEPSFTLKSCYSNQILAISTVHSQKEYYSWQDFTLPLFRKKIKKLIQPRAIIKLLSLKVDYRLIEISNQQSKVFLRLRIQNWFNPDQNQSQSFLIINPVRGYQKELKKWLKFVKINKLITLENEAIGNSCCPDQFLKHLNLPDNFSPAKNRLDKRVIFQNQTDPVDIVKNIILHSIERARENEIGILKNIDSEFLHDYRVHLRRLKSFITQLDQSMKTSYFKEIVKDIDLIFDWCSKYRDIEVVLLKKNVIKNMLTPTQADHFVQLIRHLENLKNDYYQKLTQAMKTPFYQNLFQLWQAQINETGFLAELKKSLAHFNGQDLALCLINQAYQNLIKKSARITSYSPDQQFHQVRIKTKKLRYLIEIFQPLFPGQETNLILKKLKKNQQQLGQVNDIIVTIAIFKNCRQPANPAIEYFNFEATIKTLIKKMNIRKELHKQVFLKSSKNNIKPQLMNKILNQGNNKGLT